MENENNVSLSKEEQNATPSTSLEQGVSNAVLSLKLHLDFKKELPGNGPTFQRFIELLEKYRFTPGSVLRPYSSSCVLIDSTAPNFKTISLKIADKSGFDELGLKVRIENGVLIVEGLAENDSIPTREFDGLVDIRLACNVREHNKGSNKWLASIPKYQKTQAEYMCRISFPEIEFTPKSFFITPDPKTLWKNLPSNEDAMFWKADSFFSSGTISGDVPLVVLGASQRGRSHANVGSFRDDHYVVKLGASPDDWNFFTVADGAGSAKFSREGSKIVCETVCTNLEAYFSEWRDALNKAVVAEIESKNDLAKNAFCQSDALNRTNLCQIFYKAIYEAYSAIKASSDEHSAKIGDYNTTFMCVAMKRFPATETKPALWAIASYWVGDGGLAVYEPNGEARTLALGIPDGGEFAGQTRFITSRDEIDPAKVLSRMKLCLVEDFKALVLMSDGVTDPFFTAEDDLKKYKNWKVFWDEILPNEFKGVLDASVSPERRSKALIEGLDFFRDGNHDDRTLVLVVNDAATSEPRAPETDEDELAPAPESGADNENKPSENDDNERISLDADSSDDMTLDEEEPKEELDLLSDSIELISDSVVLPSADDDSAETTDASNAQPIATASPEEFSEASDLLNPEERAAVDDLYIDKTDC